MWAPFSGDRPPAHPGVEIREQLFSYLTPLLQLLRGCPREEADPEPLREADGARDPPGAQDRQDSRDLAVDPEMQESRSQFTHVFTFSRPTK